MSEGNGYVTGKEKTFNFGYINRLLSYDPITGHFIWLTDRRSFKCAGKRAGCLGRDGYWILKISGVNFLGHRVAWLLQTGEWPKFEIDHEDLVRSNNTWANLRSATHGQNQSNSKAYKNNLLGVKGVSPMPNQPGRFRVRIRKNGRERHLGCFNSLQEAGSAYAKASQQLHGEFGRPA